VVWREGLVAVPFLGACAIEPNPDFYRQRFAFAVVSNWSGDAAALDRVLCEIRARPDVHMIFGAGDMQPPAMVFDAIEATRRNDCGLGELAYFPAFGEVERMDPVGLQAWSEAWLGGWADAPEDSDLARQLEDIADFEAAPRTDLYDPIAYAFTYRGARFVVLDAFDNPMIGIQPSFRGQSEFLRELPPHDPTHPSFAVGHVAFVPACYREEEPCNWPTCPAEQTLPWDSSFSDVLTVDIAGRLAADGTSAYFHGHDNLFGRRLLDSSGAVLYERLAYDVYDECTDMVRPLPDASEWSDLQAAPNRMWQVDAGAIQSAFATFVIATVVPEGVSLEVFAHLEGNVTVLLDAWTVPR
jgi:hypothetical protein